MPCRLSVLGEIDQPGAAHRQDRRRLAVAGVDGPGQLVEDGSAPCVQPGSLLPSVAQHSRRAVGRGVRELPTRGLSVPAQSRRRWLRGGRGSKLGTQTKSLLTTKWIGAKVFHTMRYVPAQVKEALGISEETFRHWRRALLPLSGKRGYGPCFSPRDLLGLKVISQFHALGVPVRNIAPHASKLFDACSGAWFGLEQKVMVFDGQALEVLLAPQESSLMARASVVVPLRPLINELRQRLSEEEDSSPQTEIAFPPIGMPRERSA
jgi:DNA-binding transcriptional MerR regulator